MTFSFFVTSQIKTKKRKPRKKNKAPNNDLVNENASPRLSDNPSEEGEVKVSYF